MTTWIWNGADGASWFAAENWTSDPPGPAGHPLPGDIAVIADGIARVGGGGDIAPILAGATVVLGGSGNTGQAVGLTLAGASLQGAALTVASGAAAEQAPVEARLSVLGAVEYQGSLFVEAQRGGLTIAVRDARDGTAGLLHLADDPAIGSGGDALVLVAQQSTLRVRGGTVENDGFIQVEGRARFAGTAITGDGVIEVENHGHLRIGGAVGAEQRIALPDGLARLVLADPGQFLGTLEFGPVGGAGIVLRGIHATGLSYADGVLRLETAEGGPVTLKIDPINPNDLLPLPPTLDAADFTLRDLGDRGTRLVYDPVGPTILQGSLPVPVVAAPGTQVALSDILLAAFGTTDPGFHGMTLLPVTAAREPIGYWDQTPGDGPVVPGWSVGGVATAGPIVVTPGLDVSFTVGNNIPDPPQIVVQLTPEGGDPDDAVFMVYNLWSVAPEVVGPDLVPGRPTPDDIVFSAIAHAEAYPGIVNTDFCNWIADNIAAAAGATMPFPNASLSPEQNEEGGFWRIAYRSSDQPVPVADWSGLVQPGDIVRMQWTTQTGHTTTVVGALVETAAGPKILVYDNIGPAPPEVLGLHTTALHDASYWNGTTPDGITIYRLDQDHQYLVTGSGKGEFLRGSVFDDLIRPLGGADTVAGGPGADEIEGRIRDLRGTEVQGFEAGDLLHLTDLDAATASVRLRGERLVVYGDGDRVAAIDLPGIAPGTAFTLASDGATGTLIGLDMLIG